MTEDGWWHGEVIYQIYPRSFLDTNGDGIGDLQGVIRKLDHVASLGVDAIWLSPFYPSPLHDFGYDVIDHCSVHEEYGTEEDFDQLVEEAHKRDIKIIIDAVLNHTSIEHPWFRESRQGKDNPKADWYQWADAKPDGSPPNNWISRYAESQWTWCPVREQYYRHQYMREQPSLNLRNHDVIQQRIKFMGHWLDRGVDGIRFDAVPQYAADPQLKDNPPGDPDKHSISPVGGYSTFAHQLHENDCNHPDSDKFVRELVDEIRCLGCTFCFGEIDVRYRAYDSLEHFTGEDMLDSAYTPDFMETDLTPSAFERICKAVHDTGGASCHVWALTNHDASRIVNRWSPESASPEMQARVSKFAITLLASMEGQLTFFQGEELGLHNADYAYNEIKDPQGLRFWPKGHGRDRIRHPYPWTGEHRGGFTTGEPWLPIKDDIVRLNAAAQDADENSVLNHWRRMIKLRRGNDILRHGSMVVFQANDEEGVVAVRRESDQGTVEAWFKVNDADTDAELPEGETLIASEEAWGEPYSFAVIKR